MFSKEMTDERVALKPKTTLKSEVEPERAYSVKEVSNSTTVKKGIPKRCFACGKEGHIAVQCPEKKAVKTLFYH